MKAVFTGVLLLACVGCADPALITQPVQDEPSLLVGLANHNDPENLELVQHNHPMEWSEADLHTIMARLLVEERGGIMDPFKPPPGVFSANDIIHLIPALREAFAVAGPSDWIVFAYMGFLPKITGTRSDFWGNVSPRPELSLYSLQSSRASHIIGAGWDPWHPQQPLAFIAGHQKGQALI